jgi:iron complex transport system permease protein
MERIRLGQRRARLKFLVAMTALALAAIVSVVASCGFGAVDIPFSTVLHAILSRLGIMSHEAVDMTEAVIVFDIRLSRVVLSAMVGACLAAAGVAFQGILRNPLADPFTIGVSSGAAFGASMAIFLGVASQGFWGIGALPFSALAGAICALVAVLFLARVNGELRRDTMILAGIVVATFLGALVSLLKALDEESVASIVFWIMGSFQGRGWTHVGFMLPYLIIGLLLLGASVRELDILSLGDTQAGQLGVNVNRARMKILLAASLLTAAAVSVSGVIGFVGLVVPHLVRILISPEHGKLLMASVLLGIIALTWSDVFARTLLPEGEEIPVGVVTAIIGGPFFCMLLKWKREAPTID